MSQPPRQIVSGLRSFVEPGQVVELRVLGTPKSGTVSGYFDDMNKLAQAAAAWSGRAPGVYFTPNPVNPALLARASNRVVERAKSTTSDQDITRLRWLLVDFDPKRPAGISSTDAEHDAAIARAKRCRDWLSSMGWPSPVLGDSGNGAHLPYLIDLPNDQESVELLKRCLHALDFHFSDDVVVVDQTTFNPARIWKLYGTLTCKGDSTSDRPHRLSRLLEIPERFVKVPVDLLTALAEMGPGDKPEQTPRQIGSGFHGEFDLERWIGEHGLQVESTGPWKEGGRKWVLNPCPWNPDHTNRSAFIVRWPGGKIGAGCHHNGCADKNWHSLRDLYEPDRKTKQASPLQQQPVRSDPVHDGIEQHLTDLGNAQRVVTQHGDNLRYCHPWKSWLIWDGQRWKPDDTAEAVRRAKETEANLYNRTAQKILELGTPAEKEEDNHERKAQLAKLKKILDHCFRWENAQRIAACLQLATSEPDIPVLPAQLDSDPFLFNVLNGSLDLQTGQLQDHQRSDLITKLAPVQYDSDAQCPLWLKFLERITDGNQDLISYLQRVIGYSLTADVSEQCLWFLHGAGANGKSTFLGAIRAMMGDYGMQAVSELLMQRVNEQHPTERADLFGRRFVATIETDEGKRMAESLMKQMTGGDKIRARKMRQDFFEFQPTHKIFLAANHKPTVRGTDFAVWRRIKLVPFTVTIPDDEKDKELPVKLKAELPGILAWAVRGCLKWREHGLGEPDEVRKATAAYQAEQDMVAGFLAECCFTNAGARCRASALLEAYQNWSGDKVMTPKALGQRMKDKGFESKLGTGGYTYYLGVGLPTTEGGNS
jgi:P4 family phage/plasmid primase-like protien